MGILRAESAKTATIRHRYDRAAPLYGLMERMGERGVMAAWQRRLWERVPPGRILEVGVGAGASFPFYPSGGDVTAIDFSPAMLARAGESAERRGIKVDLRLMDVQYLDFPDDSFDAFVTACVFCSVPDPLAGFAELRRVLRPEGHGYLLEHVLSCRRLLRPGMRAANPLVVRMLGANIDRQTRSSLERAGLAVESETDLWLDVVKLFVVGSGKQSV